MATATLALDGDTPVSAFGTTTPWTAGNIDALSLAGFLGDASYRVTLDLTGDWDIGLLRLRTDAEPQTRVTLTDSASGTRRITTLDLGGAAQDITLKATQVRFITGGDRDVTLRTGDQPVSAIDLFDGNHDITTGAGSVGSISLGAGDDLLRGGAGFLGSVRMGQGDNTYIGGSGFLGALVTGDGDDTVTLNAGAQSVSLGTGSDTLAVMAGFAASVSGAGDSVVTVAAGASAGAVALGGGRDRVVVAGGFVDQLGLGEGDDTLQIRSGGSANVAQLGGGDNLLEVATGSFVWSVTAFGGDDTARYTGTGRSQSLQLGEGDNSLHLSDSAQVNQVLSYGGADTLLLEGASYVGSADLGDGRDSVTLTEQASLSGLTTWGGAVLALRDDAWIDTAQLGHGGNSVTLGGAARINSLQMGDGDDTVVLGGTARIFMLKLGQGDNVLTTAGGNVESVYSYLGNNTLRLGAGGAQQITLSGDGTVQDIAATGYVGSLQVTGRASTTLVLTGGAGAVQLGGGDDVVSLGAQGLGSLSLGEGDDRVTLAPIDAAARMVLLGGTGADTLSLAGYGAAVSLSLTPQGTAQQPTAEATGLLHLSGFEGLEGTEFDDTLVGSAGADTLDGGAGADVLVGGDGGDLYRVDHIGDQVREGRGATGTDTIEASIDFRLDAVRVENLTLTGEAVLGAGNALANVITGNAMDNLLDGGRGVDTLVGGLGNDTYFIRAPGDTAVELAGEGIDTVRAFRSHALEANVENLFLQVVRSSAGDVVAVNGIGNGLANTIVGTPFANTLAGREGRDTLNGQGGADSFVFDRAPGAGNVDRIIDFNVNEANEGDLLKMKGAIFGGLAAGLLDADLFVAGPRAQEGDDRFIFDRASGQLWFDADGTGAADQILVATFEQNAQVTAADIEIF